MQNEVRVTVPERIMVALATLPDAGRTTSGWLGSLSTPLTSDMASIVFTSDVVVVVDVAGNGVSITGTRAGWS